MMDTGNLVRVMPESYAVDAAREYRAQDTLTERKIKENDDTMVTVVCITYKHEEFIAQALDSFLMQKTNFKFKVFVGEDCGPDGTADIIREYAARYPDVIIPFIREKNMGAQRNLIDLCQRATSPYIAFCEGDDYWIDEYKLQKQVDYMEKHRNLRACSTQTEIHAPEDWHLRSWYNPTRNGKLLIPDSVPGYRRQETFSPEYIIGINVAHTSTHFYRWNYDLQMPDWYYRGIIGDTPLLLLQLGSTELGHIPEITSVYRINEGSIFFSKAREENFLATRKSYISYLTGLAQYAREHFDNYPIVTVENRIKLETANYLRTLVELNDTDRIAKFFAEYPESGRISLNAYLSFYNDSRTMTRCYGWEGYQLIVRNKYWRNLLRPVVLVIRGLDAVKRGLKRGLLWMADKAKNLVSLAKYWGCSLVKKDPNLWVFSGFCKRSYMDNSKYFYEFVVEHHPEIQAVWLTNNPEVYQMLQEEGKPVAMMRSRQGRKLMARASIAVTDHFRMSDYDLFSGINHKTKIVQLWHGVGLKSIGDLKNTDVPGVQFSTDILPQPGDGTWAKLVKKIRYFRHAYYRELFEEYFMLVCPGQERIEQIAKPWHIPVENCFISGHPRNIYLHQNHTKPQKFRVLYAPTYRWDASKERELVQKIVDAGQLIQEKMEQVDGELTIRLHPHTWRNYTSVLNDLEREYSRIVIDKEKDIYQTLGEYSVIISDYSSIAYEFVLLDRPVVFFNYDYEDFIRHEVGLNYDYQEYSPGAHTKTWEATLDAVLEYRANPEKDGEWRRKVRDEFYDMSANDENNSERIVQEIKRRLEGESSAS